MEFFVEILATTIGLVFVAIIYAKWTHTYWKRLNIPFMTTTRIWGDMENPLRPKYGLKYDIKNAYDYFKKRKLRHGGIYLITRPVYIPIDLGLIKNIFSKDFQYFVSHGLPYDAKKDPLSAHLFNLDGEGWRNMRVKMTPTFTSGKMKNMFETLLNCGIPMVSHVRNLIRRGESLDIKEILACYTTDVIGSCAFGLECNSFKDPDAEFRKYGRQVFAVSLRNKALDFLRFVLPSLTKIVYIRSVDEELEKFFMNAIKGVMDHRIENNVKRNDFIQLFLEMEKKTKIEGNNDNRLTFEQIAAHAFVFFLAGFETSSTTMTFCLHELAFNQDIQSKLREEIRDTLKKNGGLFTYDAIMGMTYLDQVIQETLRKYPPVPFLMRVCTKDYKIPDSDIVLKTGTDVFVSVLGVHYDPEYYPDPQRFQPERFNEENRKKRPGFTFLPFGEGPRICIGLRFGVMQAKTGLCLLLNKYRIFPAKGEEYNIDFEPTLIILTKRGKVLLDAEELSD
ncbi:Cyp6a9 [Trypoxylus dichotomus]